MHVLVHDRRPVAGAQLLARVDQYEPVFIDYVDASRRVAAYLFETVNDVVVSLDHAHQPKCCVECADLKLFLGRELVRFRVVVTELFARERALYNGVIDGKPSRNGSLIAQSVKLGRKGIGEWLGLRERRPVRFSTVAARAAGCADHPDDDQQRDGAAQHPCSAILRRSHSNVRNHLILSESVGIGPAYQ